MITETTMKHNPKPAKVLRIGFLMDPMEKIADQDTSVSIMVEAQKRGHHVFYMEPKDLVFRTGALYSEARRVLASPKPTFHTLRRMVINLKTLDVVFIRKEPPFDLSYLYLTQMLELLEPEVFVINAPRGVRKANEKLYILEFARWIPPTMISNDPNRIARFQRQKKMDLILKPLDQKGGRGIKLLPWNTKKAAQILAQMTRQGTQLIMAQKYLRHNLTQGDKRILMLNGNVLGQFARIPKRGEFRANMSLGGRAERALLTSRERALVQSLSPKLLEDGLYFVGLDVVDGKLIEINVTSPAGIPELNELERIHPEIQVVDFLEAKASSRSR